MQKVARYSIDQNILSFTPRSTYYLELDDQIKSMESKWEELLSVDRELFSLLMILPGTNYTKGRMIHYLLSNSKNINRSKHGVRLFDEVDSLIEDQIILFNLYQMPMAAALRALMLLAGEDYAGRTLKQVNNTRTRKIIMNYVFNRDKKSLESMCVKFKSKLRKLFTHVLGQIDMYRLFKFHDLTVLNKYCRDISTGSLYNLNTCFSVIAFVKGGDEYVIESDLGGVVSDYLEMKDAAKDGNSQAFKYVLNKGTIPYEVALGFKNTYKLDVSITEVHEKGQKSERQKFKTSEASKRVGAKVDVDYSKQSIEDLYKYTYLKLDEKDSSEDAEKAFNTLVDKMIKDKEMDIDLGETVVIVDNSASMKGDDTRKYHPIVTANIIANRIPNCKSYIFSNEEGKINSVLIKPVGETELWKCLLKASKEKPDTVVVISDGYENTVEGMFEHVFNYLKETTDKPFDLVHVNPVYDSKVEGGKRLVNSIEPISVENANLFKSQYILHTLTVGDITKVKNLLRGIFNKQVGGEKYELITGKQI